MTNYEIVAAEPGELAGHRAGNWSTDAVGSDNEFATIEDAREGIANLRALGEEWAAATYAVREIGQLWPEVGTIDKPMT